MNEMRRATIERDQRPTSEIVAGLLSDLEAGRENYDIGVLHARGSQVEFDAGERLCRSASATGRDLGADILGQLGWSERTFLDEAVAILIGLLTDPEPDVVASALIALGHRNSPAAIAPALGLITHESADVRYGVVHALSRHDASEAIAGLIRFSADDDRDVRDWATFGLGSMTDLDTPELRDALLMRATDRDPEVRGEAFIGLATRHDHRILPALRKELTEEFHGSWAFEAAAHLRDPELHPLLVALLQRLKNQDLKAFGEQLNEAIRACSSDGQ